MTYSKYTNMTTDELTGLVFNAVDPDDLTLELATRLIAAEEELSEPHDYISLDAVLDKAERREGCPTRREVRVEGGRRGND